MIEGSIARDKMVDGVTLIILFVCSLFVCFLFSFIPCMIPITVKKGE